jgi:TPR repeat protein
MKILGWITVLLMIPFIQLHAVSKADTTLKYGKTIRFGNIKAREIHFGGDTTPECKLAISTDGRYFYLKKVHSTCIKQTNSKGVKIICNTDKSVCKTRQELIAFVTQEDRGDSIQNTMPSWCRSSRLNRTEHAICADETLGSLDLKLAEIYGNAKAKDKDKIQKEWLKKRNRCKSDISCIKTAYEERIAQLNEKEAEEKIAENSQKEFYGLLREMCENGDGKSCNAIAMAYDEGKGPFSVDDYKALRYYTKSCDFGFAIGCANLGLMYANGEGTGRDLHTALRYLDQGCNSGSDQGCQNAQKVREDLKNAFRGIRKSDCYRIRDYGAQRVCLEGTGGDACYGLKGYGLQRVCIDGSGTNACYGLKKYEMQRVCKEGIKSNACYGLKDYNQQRSCQNFGGSTTFWLILAHYGYYTY